MILDISFKNLDHSDALKEYVEKRSEKLKKYFKGKIHVTWNFDLQKQEHVAHCHLLGNNMDYFGESTGETFYAAVDLASDKVETQLRKHKEIVKNHLHK